MDYQDVLEQIHHRLKPEFGSGEVACYIPQLAGVDQTQFAMALHTVDGQKFSVGNADQPFSIQSISKLFALTMAIQDYDETLWDRVGREPSGDPFNSLVQLEYENGKPRNPFINSGALVLCDAIQSSRSNSKLSVLSFVQKLSGNPELNFDLDVARSEYLTGYRNIAMANFMKSFGALKNDVDSIIDSYFHHCSIAMTCNDVAQACVFLTGTSDEGDVQVVSGRQIKRINSLMMTCGTYDAAGEIAYRVGLPCKSGVGGGIVATLPGQFSVCAWSPGLDKTGNSLVGVRALEELTTITGLSIF